MFHNAINLIYLEPYHPRRVRTRGLNKIVHIFPDIVKERRYLKEVFDKYVKPKLVEVFGNFVGTAIVANAYSSSLSVMKNKKYKADNYKIVIETICSNKQVIAMWGADGTTKQKEEWLKLID